MLKHLQHLKIKRHRTYKTYETATTIEQRAVFEKSEPELGSDIRPTRTRFKQKLNRKQVNIHVVFSSVKKTNFPQKLIIIVIFEF